MKQQLINWINNKDHHFLCPFLFQQCDLCIQHFPLIQKQITTKCLDFWNSSPTNLQRKLSKKAAQYEKYDPDSPHPLCFYDSCPCTIYGETIVTNYVKKLLNERKYS